MIPILTYVPKGYRGRSSEVCCLLMKKDGSFYQTDPYALDNSILIPSKRVILEFRTDAVVYRDPADQATVSEFFGSDPYAYESYLLEAAGEIYKTLQGLERRTDLNGNRYAYVYLHKYYYRINRKKDFFNILAEYSGLMPIRYRY